ncbi:unnamed protein product [Closterium sp. NIES-54]
MLLGSAAPLVASPCPACRVALLAIASPCPAHRVALPAIASLPCHSHRPAGHRVALLPAHRIAACASPCPARAEPPCYPHHPVARRPAARATLLLPAPLAGAMLPARRPAGNRTAARTALPAPPCCCQPCCAPPY